MNLKKQIEDKTKRMQELAKEVEQLRQALNGKQVEAIKIQGAIEQLRELEEYNKK